MHEFSLAASIVDSVLKYAGSYSLRKVVGVRLVVGELTCVNPEQLRFCYSAIIKETAIDGSTLDIETGEAVVVCPSCSYRGRPKYWDDALAFAPIATLQCPECGKVVEASEGRECTIKAIRYVD